MRALISLVLLFSGVVTDALAWYLLLGTSTRLPSMHLLIFMGVHGLAMAPVTFAVYFGLPERYRQNAAAAVVFVYSLSFFVPILGPIGGAIALLLGLYRPHTDNNEDWQRHIPDLPYKPINVTGDHVFTRSGLNTVLLHFDDPDWRQRAVMASRHLPDRQAIPILKATLTDSSDEVRLLAYSMLSTKEGNLESRIESVSARLNPNGKGPDWVDEALSNLYWEQAYLGLVEGEVHTYVLERALDHINTALELRPTPGRYYLRGRICLRLGRLPESAQALDAAEAGGMSVDDIAPYRAELAFVQKHYDQVSLELARIGPEARQAPVLNALIQYWS